MPDKVKITERKANGTSWDRAQGGTQRTFPLAADAPPARVPGWFVGLALVGLIVLCAWNA